MTLLGYGAGELDRRGGAWTAREIRQQPEVWKATQELIRGEAPAVRAFLAPLLARPDLRIILTGAGSSAFIGRCLQPELLAALGRRVEVLATTDLVAGPTQYLQPEVPTLLVSFARSGSSPESVAATELADDVVRDCHHLVITCNAEGALYRRHAGRARSHAVLLPKATHDRGMAMTSSFSAMLYAGLVLLHPEASLDVPRIGRAAEAVLEDGAALIRALASGPHRRVVFLGSRCLQGLADEAALKLLELTDGEVVAIAESPLGFRHGPKAFLDAGTLVVVLASNDPLVRRYDLDLARELVEEGVAGRVLVLSASAGDLGGLDAVIPPGLDGAADGELCFPYIVWAQMLALGHSLALGRTPDDPSRSGTVSRVVKGVVIHRAGAPR